MIHVELMCELGSDWPHDFRDLFYQEIMTSQSLVMPHVSFLIFVFSGLKNDERLCLIVICIEEKKTGHGDRDVTVTFQVMRKFYINNFYIFEFLDLEYG